MSPQTNYHDDIIKKADSFRKPFVKLVIRERRRRMTSIVKDITACCVDNELLSKDPQNYLEGNKDLAKEIADF